MKCNLSLSTTTTRPTHNHNKCYIIVLITYNTYIDTYSGVGTFSIRILLVSAVSGFMVFVRKSISPRKMNWEDIL